CTSVRAPASLVPRPSCSTKQLTSSRSSGRKSSRRCYGTSSLRSSVPHEVGTVGRRVHACCSEFPFIWTFFPCGSGSTVAEGTMAVKLIKDLYTATVQVTGGRRGGIARSSDKILDLPLQAPREPGGPGGATDPEQLFAAAYAACYTSALGVVARERKHALGDTRVTADVTLGTDSAGRY